MTINQFIAWVDSQGIDKNAEIRLFNDSSEWYGMNTVEESHLKYHQKVVYINFGGDWGVENMLPSKKRR